MGIPTWHVVIFDKQINPAFIYNAWILFFKFLYQEGLA